MQASSSFSLCSSLACETAAYPSWRDATRPQSRRMQLLIGEAIEAAQQGKDGKQHSFPPSSLPPPNDPLNLICLYPTSILGASMLSNLTPLLVLSVAIRGSDIQIGEMEGEAITYNDYFNESSDAGSYIQVSPPLPLSSPLLEIYPLDGLTRGYAVRGGGGLRRQRLHDR